MNIWDPTMRGFHCWRPGVDLGHLHYMGMCGGCLEVAAAKRAYTSNRKRLFGFGIRMLGWCKPELVFWSAEVLAAGSTAVERYPAR